MKKGSKAQWYENVR